MRSYRISRVVNVPQTTLQSIMLKTGRKAQVKEYETKLGRKQVLPCEAENDVAEQCLLMERKFYGLTMADVTCLAYQLAVRYGIKNQFCTRNEKAGKISYVVIHKFQLELLKVFHSQQRGISLPNQ